MKRHVVRAFQSRSRRFKATTLSEHYIKHSFEPLHITQIVKTGWYEVEGLVSYLIHGVYADGKAFLAFVCEEDGQLALDWQAFTGHNTVPFTEFLDEKINDPTEMRVVAQSISVETLPELSEDYRFVRNRSDSCWALVKKHSPAGARSLLSSHHRKTRLSPSSQPRVKSPQNPTKSHQIPPNPAKSRLAAPS